MKKVLKKLIDTLKDQERVPVILIYIAALKHFASLSAKKRKNLLKKEFNRYF